MSDDKIPLARPSLGAAESAALQAVLDSGRLVNGPRCVQLERMLAQRCGRRHAVAVASGTAALELSLWALGVGNGDEVVVPAFGFPAAAHAVVARGAAPIPADVEAATWNLDPHSAAAAITRSTRAVIAIDQLGLVAETSELSELGVDIVADSACSLGGTDSAGVGGGGYGRLAILSFHPRKLVTTGEGGAVLCDDDELAAALQQLRNLGQSSPGAFARIGTNARMSELHAAVGCVQMERLDAMLAERRLLAQGYDERLEPLIRAGRLSVQAVPAGAQHSYQTYAVRLADGVSRDEVRARLLDADIETGPATYAFTELGVFAEWERPMPVSAALHARGLALPLYIGMRSSELDRVAAALTEVIG